MFNVIYVLYVPLQKKYYKNNLHTDSKLVDLCMSIFPPFKKAKKKYIIPEKLLKSCKTKRIHLLWYDYKQK